VTSIMCMTRKRIDQFANPELFELMRVPEISIYIYKRVIRGLRQLGTKGYQAERNVCDGSTRFGAMSLNQAWERTASCPAATTPPLALQTFLDLTTFP